MAKDDSTKLSLNASFTDGGIHANLRVKGNVSRFGTKADTVMSQVGLDCFKSLLPAIKTGLALLKPNPGTTVETEEVDVSFNGVSCRLTVAVQLDYEISREQLDVHELIKRNVTEPAADLITELILEKAPKAQSDVFDTLFDAAEALLGGRVRAARSLLDLDINPLDLVGGKKGFSDLFSSVFGTTEAAPPRREPHGPRPPHSGTQPSRPANGPSTQRKPAGDTDPHMM